MSEARSRRIESEIQRVLAALIAREVKDPRVGNVTITAVHVAPDMGTARVYFTPFASREPPEQVRHGLTHAASFLRGELGRRLSLRHAPRLEFVFDESAADAERLTSLIDRAVAADRAAHDAGVPGEADSAGGADSPAPGSAGAGDPRR
ncbi:MAG TPA: 30S ribosome-binding factor RbfA [Steroidobacteraceae bacterium]|jgi:ribosome-binding factor A|nr:30S ribosome-binding factor RbfA [Steroidobacteraceae bacterium]